MALDRTWYNALVNDSGGGLDGSVWRKEDVDALMDAIDAEIARLESPAACLLQNNAAFSFGTGVWANIAFATEEYDPLNMHTGTDAYIYVPVAGIYQVNAVCVWPPSPTGNRGIVIGVNDTWRVPNQFDKAFDGGGAIGVSARIATLLALSANDKVAVQLYQDSGVAQTIGAGAARLSVARIK